MMMARARITRLSTRFVDVASYSAIFLRLDDAMTADGYAVVRASLWRCADGAFIARAEWRRRNRAVDALRYTITGPLR